MTTPNSEPFYFGLDDGTPGDRPLFGWLHRTSGAAHLGLVIVPPFGYEAICAHRSLRHIAEAAAAAGVPALRFDLDGTGDSAGDDADPDRVAAWIASIGKAIGALRRATGVTRVSLLGVRTGALLAAAAAASRDDVAGLIAIAPVIAGRAFAREMKALQMALGLAAPPAGAPPAPEGEQEAVGFRITAETRDALGKLDSAKATKRPAPEILILDRDDMPPTDRWAEHLRGLGAVVTQRREPGYVDMVADPHKAKVPQAMIAAAIPWLRELAASLPPRDGAAAPSSLPTSATMHGVVETAVSIGGPRGLFGILSAPPSGRGRRAILLLNAGSVHHIGPNRLYVALARRWAREGHVVLRVDISGIGDSSPRPGNDENITYPTCAVEDVADVVAFLHGLPDVAEVHVAGLCAGAYHAFKAAVAGHPIKSIVPINPLTFFWKEGMSVDVGEFRVSADAARYASAARDPEKWKKLLRGQVNLRALAEVVIRRAASLSARHGRDLARRIGRPFPDDLGAELEKIARMGVRLTFLFTSDDPGFDLLRVLGGSSVPRLSRRRMLRWELIEGPDHTFTPMWSHPVFAERLSAILDGTATRP